MEKKFVEINLNENAYGMACHDGCQRLKGMPTGG